MATTPKAAPRAEYIRGIGKLVFGGNTCGYIKKGSFKPNGAKAEYSPVEAEQVPHAPVDYIVTKPASIKPTFTIIQTDYQTLYDTMGGTLIKTGAGDEEKIVGWDGPAGFEVPRGDFELHFYTGKVQYVPSSILFASLAGNVEFASNLEVECELLPIASLTDDQKATYGIYDSMEVANTPEG